MDPKPTELWLIGPHDGHGPKTVACVLETHGAHVAVAFTDSDPDLASDQDLCYAAGIAAPWAVRLSCDLIGPVRTSQFIRRVGRVPDPLEALRSASWEGFFVRGLSGRRGLPLTGPADSRWAQALARLEEAQVYWLAPLSDFD